MLIQKCFHLATKEYTESVNCIVMFTGKKILFVSNDVYIHIS